MSEFAEHFLELVSDPAHLAFEIFTMLIFDILILGLAWPFLKRSIHRHIDKEHGVDHNGRMDNSLDPVDRVRSGDGNFRIVEQGEERHPQRTRLVVGSSQGQADWVESSPGSIAFGVDLADGPLPNWWALLMGLKPLKCKTCWHKPNHKDLDIQGPDGNVVISWWCEDCGDRNVATRETPPEPQSS